MGVDHSGNWCEHFIVICNIIRINLKKTILLKYLYLTIFDLDLFFFHDSSNKGLCNIILSMQGRTRGM